MTSVTFQKLPTPPSLHPAFPHPIRENAVVRKVPLVNPSADKGEVFASAQVFCGRGRRAEQFLCMEPVLTSIAVSWAASWHCWAWGLCTVSPHLSGSHPGISPQRRGAGGSGSEGRSFPFYSCGFPSVK